VGLTVINEKIMPVVEIRCIYWVFSCSASLNSYRISAPGHKNNSLFAQTQKEPQVGLISY